MIIPIVCYRRRSFERVYFDHAATPESHRYNLEQIAQEVGLSVDEVDTRLRAFLYATPAREIPRGIPRIVDGA